MSPSMQKKLRREIEFSDYNRVVFASEVSDVELT